MRGERGGVDVSTSVSTAHQLSTDPVPIHLLGPSPRDHLQSSHPGPAVTPSPSAPLMGKGPSQVRPWRLFLQTLPAARLVNPSCP